MNEELHEQEIRQLERELRSYGDPYASPEPDERYFANFRARVMERISEQPQPVGLMQRASEFFFGSTLRMAISGGSLVAATLVYFTLQSSPEQPVAHQAQPEQPIAIPQATQQDPLAQQPAVTAPMQTEQVIAPKVAAVKEQRQVTTSAPVQDKISETNPTQNIAEASAAFDDIDELSMSDESDPVSYDKLSMEELEAVLKTLETEPLTIQ